MTAAISFRSESGCQPAALLRLLGRPKPPLPMDARSGSAPMLEDSSDIICQPASFGAHACINAATDAPTTKPDADAMDTACAADMPSLPEPQPAAALPVCEVWGSSVWRICTGPTALAQAAANGPADVSSAPLAAAEGAGAENAGSPLAPQPPRPALPTRCVVQQTSPPRPARPGFGSMSNSSGSGGLGAAWRVGDGGRQRPTSPSPPRRQSSPGRCWRAAAAHGCSTGLSGDDRAATAAAAATPSKQPPPLPPPPSQQHQQQHQHHHHHHHQQHQQQHPITGCASDSDWDSDSDAERSGTGRAVRRRRAVPCSGGGGRGGACCCCCGGDACAKSLRGSLSPPRPARPQQPCQGGGSGTGAAAVAHNQQLQPQPQLERDPAPRHKLKSRLCEHVQVMVSESLTAALRLELQQPTAAAAAAAARSHSCTNVSACTGGPGCSTGGGNVGGGRGAALFGGAMPGHSHHAGAAVAVTLAGLGPGPGPGSGAHALQWGREAAPRQRSVGLTRKRLLQ